MSKKFKCHVPPRLTRSHPKKTNVMNFNETKIGRLIKGGFDGLTGEEFGDAVKPEFQFYCRFKFWFRFYGCKRK